MRAILYVLAIVVANVVTAKFTPLTLGAFIIPMGTIFIGLTFILRDLAQNKYGRKNIYIVMAIAMLVSAVTSYALGDTLWIVFASVLSFAVAETTDTEIYTRLKLPMSWRVLYSGVVGGILDSAIFVIVGLSPLGAGFVPWEFVPFAILGQVIVKTTLQLLGALVIRTIHRNRNIVKI